MTNCRFCGSASALLYEALNDRMGDAPGNWNLIQCTQPDCGLIWIDPVPDAQTLAIAYARYYTHCTTHPGSGLRRLYLGARVSYLGRRFGYPVPECRWWVRVIGLLLALLPHRRIAMEALVLWLPWKSGGQLLEVGCGNGERLALLQGLGWKVIGIDTDPAATEIAKNRGLDVRTGTLASNSFTAGTFNAVLMSHVIEHVPDPQETIRECRRLLRPGGMLVMLTPNTVSLGHRWFGKDWLHLDPPRHLHLFNRRNLTKLCADAGYADVGCVTTPRDAHWTLGASAALKRQDSYAIGQLPVALRLLGLFLYYMEWVVLFFRPGCGEEILVTARQPDQASQTYLHDLESHH